ncbi:MAG: alpha/beta hydrolase [Planctomycetes bacterium]|nr:alpha/beta hydrolase [Planctomycetota bacterium]
MHCLLYAALALTLPELPTPALEAPDPIVLELWPGGVPGAPETIPEEVWTGGAGDAHVANVYVPSITVHLPKPEEANGCAVVICPGGGYALLAIDKEGHDIARWFAARGVAGVVLKYRMPRPEGHVFGHEAPIGDCRKAFELTRSHAKEWNIDPQRVGVMGFSAGGHLAASASVQLTEAPPAFSVLVYPVVTMKGKFSHSGSGKRLLGESPSDELIKRFSSEQHVTSKTPRAFLVHAADDWVPVANSRIYAAALEEAKVPYELHVFSKGGHGFGMRKPNESVGKWPLLLEAWMQAEGFLGD